MAKNAHLLTVATVGSLAAMTFACGTADPVVRGASQRDSAGIRIVENSAPLLSPENAWTVVSTPSFEIGADERDSMQRLDAVESAVRLDNGRIVLANATDPILRWYDSTGKFAFGAGRFGQGPGEFDGGEGRAWIYTIWRGGGDSLATWEHSPRRMQVFDPNGKFVRAVVADLPPLMADMAYPQVVGQFAGGFAMFLLDEREGKPRQLGVVIRDSLDLISYGDNGRFNRKIARVPGLSRHYQEVTVPENGRTYQTALAVPFAAPFVIWSDRGRLYYGSGDRYEVVAYDSSGAVRMLIRKTLPLRPLTSAIIEQYKETRRAAVRSNPERLRNVENAIQKLPPFRDSLPAYRRILTDRDGMLWVQDYNLPTEAQVNWSVFDLEGRWVTTVSIPRTWQVTDIGRNHILTVERDSLDVEKVRMYELRRTRS
jgi:hypothetical protein